MSALPVPDTRARSIAHVNGVIRRYEHNRAFNVVAALVRFEACLYFQAPVVVIDEDRWSEYRLNKIAGPSA